MTADTYRQAIRAIDAALTAEERALIEERHGVAAWSGAPFDDILDGLIAHDAYCYRTDPFLDEHGDEIPSGPPPGPDGGPTVRLYAAYAVFATGADLTVDAVTGLMARAGLYPATTRQTPAPIERMSLNATNRLASELARFYAEGRLTGDLPYQRGSVWTLDQRIALVKSWLSGTPIASVILNDRSSLAWTDRNGFPADGALWAVIDGKQRIETAAMWFNGIFAVPASWFRADLVADAEDTDDGPYVRFTGLTETGRRIFENRAMLPAATASVASVEAEAEIYLRVNGGGTVQAAEDMARAERVANEES